MLQHSVIIHSVILAETQTQHNVTDTLTAVLSSGGSHLGVTETTMNSENIKQS